MSALFKWHSRPQPEDGALGKVEARLDLTIEESEVKEWRYELNAKAPKSNLCLFRRLVVRRRRCP